MKTNLLLLLLALASTVLAPAPASAQDATSSQTFRLHEGITAYVVNPDGKDFSVGLDVRDLNLYANGPREILFKVYDPDGTPVVREVIPDDGCATANQPDRLGGWDHELQSYINHYAKGTVPSYRWSAWSEPSRLKTQVARTFDRAIKGGKRGTYRVVLAGTPDHYVTLRLPAGLKYGVAGHPTFIHGHGDMFKKSYIYVPKGTSGIFLAIAEPDEPRNRQFKLTAPDGTVLFDGVATGGYNSNEGNHWKPRNQSFAAASKTAQFDGKLLTLEVTSGPNDYLLNVTLQQPRKDAFADYVGFGASAIFCSDEATATAIAGGTVVEDDLVFWHPFQVRFHQWLKKNPATNPELLKELQALFNGFRLLETSDGRGSASWSNWAYAMGYYGCRVFQPGWQLMQRNDVAPELKAIIKEGLIMAGDRLSFATHIEKVNGNAFSQINVALWYSHRATGDALQKEFEVVAINPVILDSKGASKDREGCLSFPSLYQDIRRAKTVRVQAYGLDGQPFEMTCADLPARVWQHEIDHLQGTLFIDKMGPLARMGSKKYLEGFILDFEDALKRGTLPPGTEMKL